MSDYTLSLLAATLDCVADRVAHGESVESALRNVSDSLRESVSNFVTETPIENRAGLFEGKFPPFKLKIK